MPKTDTAIIDLSSSTIARYLEAHEEVQRRLGVSPGPEFLMALAIRGEDPMQLVDDFCSEIVATLRAEKH